MLLPASLGMQVILSAQIEKDSINRLKNPDEKAYSSGFIYQDINRT
jgi:hypothetical protein